MGRIFNGPNSPSITIPNWFPDEATDWWNYRSISASVRLKHTQGFASQDSAMLIKGGPFYLRCDISSYNLCANMYQRDLQSAWGQPQTIYGAASAGNDLLAGVVYNWNPTWLPNNTVLDYNFGATLSGDHTLNCSGGVPGYHTNSKTHDFNHYSYGDDPWYFFPAEYYLFNYQVHGARDLTIHAYNDLFYGELFTITTTITYTDGTVWTRTRDFTGGTADTAEPIDIIQTIGDGMLVFDTLRSAPGLPLIYPVGDPQAIKFDTLRQLGGNTTLLDPEQPQGIIFDTKRTLWGDFVTNNPNAIAFDTLRRTGLETQSAPPIDTHRFLGVLVRSETDTVRKIDGAEVIVPVDTLR